MGAPVLDCCLELAIMFCSSTFSPLLLYYNQSFLTSHDHPCCLALNYLLLENILPCSAKNRWKSLSWDLARVEQAGNTLMFPFPLPAWWLLILVPILIHHRHNILWKAVSARSSVIYIWLLKVQYLVLLFSEPHPFFFLQDISLIHHNYFDTQFKNSLLQFTYFGNDFHR